MASNSEAENSDSFNLSLKEVGKRFNRDWIFKNLDFNFYSGKSYAVLGPNGCGKSTLLQVLAGSMDPSKGKINLFQKNESIPVEKWYKYLSWCAPYIDLIEELTLIEALEFQSNFKPFAQNLEIKNIPNLIQLSGQENKNIRNFSSGMKQRLKLALSLLSSSPIIFLDEPCTNLDQKGVDLYLNLVNKFAKDKMLIIASNQKQEYDFCSDQLLLEEFKS